MVLNTGPLDWESSALTTRPLEILEYLLMFIWYSCGNCLAFFFCHFDDSNFTGASEINCFASFELYAGPFIDILHWQEQFFRRDFSSAEMSKLAKLLYRFYAMQIR